MVTLEQLEGGSRGRGNRWRWKHGRHFFGSGAVVLGVEAAVAVEDLFAGDGGDAIAGDDDADQIHGVGRGDGDDSGAVSSAGGTEGLDGFG
jgi:hypothetical protein